MLNKTEAHALNETIFLQEFFTAEERKTFFTALAIAFCFSCGEERGELGECSCLVERETEEPDLPSAL